MRPPLTRALLTESDARDPLRSFRDAFFIPDGVIYLDGNSLGMLSRAASERVTHVVSEEWGRSLIASWNEHGWIDLPLRAGARISGLIGAGENETIACDSVSVNLFKVLSAALRLRPGRNVLLMDESDFPTDLHIAQGLCALLGNDCRIVFTSPADVSDMLNDDVAVAVFSHVHYKTAQIADMQAITAAVRNAGALSIWDLSHSVGALPVHLNHAGADFAVGCGYKYLNGGPGAPAFLFAASRHHSEMAQPLSGWLGHAAPFAFESRYKPAPGIRRMLTGTPPILSMSALDASVAIIAQAGIENLREKSTRMTRLFIDLVAQECADGPLRLGSPDDDRARGSHVTFHHPDGYAIVQALKARGVIGDFREPDCMRFGIAPVYLSFVDIWEAVQHLKSVLETGEWNAPSFKLRAAVT